MYINYAFYVDSHIAWQSMPSEKKCYRLFYVAEGKLKLSCMMKTVKIGKNQAVILKPGDRVSIARAESECIKLWEVGFLTENLNLRTMTPLFCTKPSSAKALLSLIREDTKNSDLLLSRLISFLDCNDIGDACEIADAAEAFVQANLNKVITTDDVAAELGINKNSLVKNYLSARCESIKTYITNAKISYAKELLEFSMLNLTEISQLLGFEETNLFTKFFTYHTKLSPANYRRRVNGV